MKNLKADVNQLVGVVLRLPSSRPQGNMVMADPKRKAVKLAEELR